ncbi:MAG TPA: RsmG family class I SAM-dependent methyltransferase, partial [Pyrinomonadaceae bacterium]|nr:RsmG family class I SAM-dependent methyltransferase [Pyrinomonadaceae bacterium]
RAQPSRVVAISGDGNVVAFVSSSLPPCNNCPGRSEVAVYDRTLGDVQVVNVGWDGSPANDFGSNEAVALDSTGRYVGFISLAGNLVIGDSNNGADMFLRDRGPMPACAYQVSPPVVDVGAGGGLPTIPCLIVQPDLRAVLIESSQKKAVFLRESLSHAGVSARASVINERFETVVAPAVDFVTCRALDRFEEMLPKLLDWAPVNSTLLLFGGEALEARIKRLGVISERALMPRSEGRFLFVVPLVP